MPPLSGGRIRHGVLFALRHPEGSPEEASFLDTVRALEAIPGVEAFELVREVSPKNIYAYALSMEFADRDAYSGYDGHPDHRAFVEGRWIPEVADFLETDGAVLG